MEKSFYSLMFFGLLIQFAEITVWVAMMVWIILAFSKKKYWKALLPTSIFAAFFLLNLYQNSTRKIVKDFEKAAHIKMPEQYKVLQKEDKYLFLGDTHVILEIELARDSINKIIREVDEKNIPRVIYNSQGLLRLSFQDDKMDFDVNVDSIKKTILIQKYWNFYTQIF